MDLQTNISKWNKGWAIFAWLLVAIMLVVVGATTYWNGFKEFGPNLADYDKYEVNCGYARTLPPNEEKVLAFVFHIYDLSEHDVNYIRVKTSGIQNDNSTVSFYAYNNDDTVCFKIVNQPLKEGNNDFPISDTDFYKGHLIIEGESQNILVGVEFCESIEPLSFNSALPFTALILLGYVALSYFGYKLALRLRGATQEPVAARLIGNHINLRPLSQCVFNEKITSLIRISAFVLMAILMVYTTTQGTYRKGFAKFHLMELLLLLIVCAASVMEQRNASLCRNIRRISFDKVIIFSFLAFALMTLVSDIIVAKFHYRFSWTLNCIFLILFYAIWNKRGDFDLLIKNYATSVQIFALFYFYLSLTKNESTIPLREGGPFTNPSIHGLFVAAIGVVMIGLLEEQIRSRESFIKIMFTASEAFLALFLVWKTQSVTPIISIFLVLMIFATRLIFNVIANKTGEKKAKTIVLTASSLGAICFIIVILLVIKTDAFATFFEQGSGARIYDKLRSANLSALLSGRDYYYRVYIRDMNLVGHEWTPILWGHHRLPHNAVIGMAYYYGVFAAIPYLVFMLSSVIKSIKHSFTDNRFAALPMYCILSFFVMSMFDNVEQSFVWLPWLNNYVMIAVVIGSNTSTNSPSVDQTLKQEQCD